MTKYQARRLIFYTRCSRLGQKGKKKGFPNNVQDPKWQSEESKDARHDGTCGVKVLFSGVTPQLWPMTPLDEGLAPP